MIHRTHVPEPPRGPAWITNYQERVSREEFVDGLHQVAEAFASGPAAEINGVTVVIPSNVDFVVRYERTPHGSYALLARIEWQENDVASPHTATTLRINPALGPNILRDAV